MILSDNDSREEILSALGAGASDATGLTALGLATRGLRGVVEALRTAFFLTGGASGSSFSAPARSRMLSTIRLCTTRTPR